MTGEPFYRSIVEETLDYVVRKMTSSEGGFYSAQDADSEGEEGRFFIWTPDQVHAVLGDQPDPFLIPIGLWAVAPGVESGWTERITLGS